MALKFEGNERSMYSRAVSIFLECRQESELQALVLEIQVEQQSREAAAAEASAVLQTQCTETAAARVRPTAHSVTAPGSFCHSDRHLALSLYLARLPCPDCGHHTVHLFIAHIPDASTIASLSHCLPGMQAELAAAQSASVRQLSEAAEVAEELQAAKAQLTSAYDAVASMRTETSTTQERLTEARRQVRALESISLLPITPLTHMTSLFCEAAV
jgi:hypothetical protein